jgi:hypothetical protein
VTRRVTDLPGGQISSLQAFCRVRTPLATCPAVASNPALRDLPESRRLVTIDEVLEALSALDPAPKGPPGGKPARGKSAARVGMAA